MFKCSNMTIDSLCMLAGDMNTSIKKFDMIQHNKKIEFAVSIPLPLLTYFLGATPRGGDQGILKEKGERVEEAGQGQEEAAKPEQEVL